MSRVAVDLDRLADLVDRMSSFTGHLGRMRAEVEARARGLDTAWSGEAAQARAQAQAHWSAAAAEVHEALAELRSIAATAHANYASAALANRRMWAG